MQGILEITNLFLHPYDVFDDKIEDAILWVENQDKIEITEDKRNEIKNHFYNMLKEFEENGAYKDALSFVDNLLVNYDYIEEVRNFLNN